MQIKAISFLHILSVYSHTKSNTPVLVWSLQLSYFELTHVNEHFSVTIDCVRLLIRIFPLYTYSMGRIQTIKTSATYAILKYFIIKTVHFIILRICECMAISISNSSKDCGKFSFFVERQAMWFRHEKILYLDWLF